MPLRVNKRPNKQLKGLYIISPAQDREGSDPTVQIKPGAVPKRRSPRWEGTWTVERLERVESDFVLSLLLGRSSRVFLYLLLLLSFRDLRFSA